MPPPGNPRSDDRTVRVFISSTFRDMHAERDHLVTVVFPQLRERLDLLDLEFFDVDLRWGIPETGIDGEKANSWAYCKQWINRVEPFFVCILGQRYGYQPPRREIRDDEDRDMEGLSITEMEVRHAVLSQRVRRRSFFYLRDAAVPLQTRRDIYEKFVDADAASIDLFKRRVENGARPVRKYPCQWAGDHFIDLDSLGEMVLEDLWSGVLRDTRYVSKDIWRDVLGHDPDSHSIYTDETKTIDEQTWRRIVERARPAPLTPLEAERRQMSAFAQTRLRWFQGRTRELAELQKFIDDAATDDAPRLCVVAAAPGAGKSALLAKLSESLAARGLAHPQPDFVITHFVGASERSADARSLLLRLIQELDASTIPFPPEENPTEDLDGLRTRLSRRLADYTGDRRIVILLDALNQLTDGHDLSWLPYRLGPSVRIIASCIEAPTAQGQAPSFSPGSSTQILTALNGRHPHRIALDQLTETDIRTIVVEYLKEYCKELDARHINAIAALPQARNPLYLFVLLAELRTLGGDDMNRVVAELITELSNRFPDTTHLFNWTIDRCAEAFGAEEAKLWCTYLALGRVGMSSRELADLLDRHLCAKARRTALLIERSLRRYLLKRGEQLDFFHGQMRQAVEARYTSNESERQLAHEQLANYFRNTADPGRQRKWECESARPFSELPHHLQHAGKQNVEQFIGVMEDLFFLEAKNRLGLIFELPADFDAARAAAGETHPHSQVLLLLKKALRRDIHFIHKRRRDYPQVVFQSLWNSAWWYDTPEVQHHFEVPAGGWNSYNAPWLRAGVKVCDLLTLWRSQREQRFPKFVWMRSVRPPRTALTSPLAAVFQHDSAVFAVAFSSDGRCLATGSADGNLRLHDVDGSGVRVVLRGHQQGITHLAFSRDGKRIATGSRDGSIRLWTSDGSGASKVLHGHTSDIIAVAFTAEHRVISASADDTVLFWDADGRNKHEILKVRDLHSMALSPDDRRLVVGFGEVEVSICDTAPHANPKLIFAQLGPVTGLAFSPDGHRVASCSSNDIAIWDPDANGTAVHLLGHRDALRVAYSPNGRHIASGSKDSTVRVWRSDGSGNPTILRGHEQRVTSVAFSTDGRHLASGSVDGAVCLWELDADQDTLRPAEHDQSFFRTAFAPDGRSFALDSRGSVNVFSTELGRRSIRLGDEDVTPSSIVFSPDSRRLAVRTDDAVRLYNADGTGEPITLARDRSPIYQMVFSHDSRRIAVLSQYGKIQVWNVEEATLSTTLDAGEKAACVAFSGDGRRIAAGDFNQRLRIWDLDEVNQPIVIYEHTDYITEIVFVPGQANLVFESNDDLFVLNLLRNQATKILNVATPAAVAAALATGVPCPDESRLVDLDSGKTIAWSPVTLRHAFPSTFRYAAKSPGYMHIFQLEGDWGSVMGCRSGGKGP